MKRYSTLLLSILALGMMGSAQAGSTTETAVVTGVGAAAGTAIGQQVGGKTGGIIGGAIGGATGAAISTDGSGKKGAIVGGAIGGAGGAAVGQKMGGSTGAIIGSGVGAAAGSAVGKEVTEDSKKATTVRAGEPVRTGTAVQVRVGDDDDRYERDGKYKNKHKKHKDHPPGNAYGWDKNHRD